MAVGRCIRWPWPQLQTLTSDSATDTQHAGHPVADRAAHHGPRQRGAPELLTLREYNRLARLLREKQRQPADFIGPAAAETIEMAAGVFGRARLESLLGCGFLLSQAVDRWNTRAIWVVSRADNAYPRRIKARLKEDAPPVLYGCGETALLDTGGLAVCIVPPGG